jgi:hypothetical protein
MTVFALAYPLGERGSQLVAVAKQEGSLTEPRVLAGDADMNCGNVIRCGVQRMRLCLLY